MTAPCGNEQTLDIVIITKNQDWNVRRLVESVLAETACVSIGDVILVDSASTDATVEIATEYPIRVVRLNRNQRLTAAAGRQAGLTQTRGDIVLFLDGDMELRPGWIPAAMSLLAQEHDIAAVSGLVIDQPKSASIPSDIRIPLDSDWTAYDDVPHGGGAAAYRREVLESVGSFNPYLFSDEEPELCLRLRQAGHRIARLRQPIVFHYSDPANAISTLFARRNRSLYLGPGQAIRLHLRSRLLLPYARERGFGLVPTAGIATGVACGLAVLGSRGPRWLLAWLAGVTAVFGVYSVRRRSGYRALFGLVQRLLFAEGTIRGFLMSPSDPSTFPYTIEVIK